MWCVLAQLHIIAIFLFPLFSGCVYSTIILMEALSILTMADYVRTILSCIVCVYTNLGRYLCSRDSQFSTSYFPPLTPQNGRGWNIINSWFIISSFQRFPRSNALAIALMSQLWQKKKCHSYCCYISYPIVIIFSACHQIKERKISITIIPNNGAWSWFGGMALLVVLRCLRVREQNRRAGQRWNWHGDDTFATVCRRRWRLDKDNGIMNLQPQTPRAGRFLEGCGSATKF